MTANEAYDLIEDLGKRDCLPPLMKAVSERGIMAEVESWGSDGRREIHVIELWPSMVVAILDLAGRLEECENLDDLIRVFESTQISQWPAQQQLARRATEIHAMVATRRTIEREKHELN